MIYIIAQSNCKTPISETLVQLSILKNCNCKICPGVLGGTKFRVRGTSLLFIPEHYAPLFTISAPENGVCYMSQVLSNKFKNGVELRNVTSVYLQHHNKPRVGIHVRRERGKNTRCVPVVFNL